MKIYKYLSVLFVLSVLAFPASAQDNEAPVKPDSTENAAEGANRTPDILQHMETLESETNQVSYAIGINIARNLKANYPNVNIDFFVLAVRDAFAGNPPKMNENMINASIVKYSTEANRIARSRVENITEMNLKNADRFLVVNGKKDGVVTTPSGLQYRVISTGAGPKPGPDMAVRFNYTTRLVGGGVIDSTLIPGGKPVQVDLKSAIPAWKEAISQMNLGSKWEIYVHPKLAYGEKGAKNVGPNQLLIYTIELLGFD